MKKTNITLSIALAAVFSSSMAFAEAEVTGKIVHESAKFTTSGTTIGAATAHGKDAFKQETSARIYIDGAADELQEGATYHVELNLMKDGKATTNYDSNESYTQRDALREAYVDTTVDDWSIRAGKQQVVWGTADGMKLLDMINPTDYSEMAQNQMEDSRIPVWMVNAETTNADGSEFQVIVSQPRENVFAGLNRNISTATRNNGAVTGGYTNAGWNSPAMFASYGADSAAIGADQGQPFVLKGVDTITGKTNGFLNVVPDLGTVAALFGRAFQTQGTNDEKGLALTAHATAAGGPAHAGFTVGGFNSDTKLSAFSTQFGAQSTTDDGFEDTNLGLTAFWRDTNGVYDAAAGTGMEETASSTDGGTFYSGKQTLAAFAAKFGTNLNITSTTAVDSVFEYMDRTSFATFDAFVNATSEYVYNMPDDTDMNLAFRTNNSTKDGLNYSLVYSYNYDQNPVIDLSWRDSSGNEVVSTRGAAFYTVDTPGSAAGADANKTAIVMLSGLGAAAESYAKLRFTETQKRAQNIGGSLDYAIDTKSLGPVILRAEGLYQKGVYSPIIDRGAMAIGDLTKALKMTKGDKFKYVVGADVTALTNMMISAQFIQERNLDYVDNNVDFDGSTACNANDSMAAENCGVYTADFASMHMTNGFNKAEENKNFYSLFLSKPFGASGEHRWNNIFMFEENGGKWNRLDAEFSIDDDTQATVEYNKYWGDANTQFGQLEASSNIQVGVKYSF